MSQVYSFGQVSLPTGVTPIPATAVPASVTSCVVSINRCTTATPLNWPDAATTLDVALELSFDNQATWVGGGSVTGWSGGIAFKRDKVTEQPTSDLALTYVTHPTHVRGTITVTNGPLVTSGGQIVMS
jgi:hypothetical protein